MNLLRRFENHMWHPFATGRHPLRGCYPTPRHTSPHFTLPHHRLLRHDQPDAGVCGVPVDAGILCCSPNSAEPRQGFPICSRGHSRPSLVLFPNSAEPHQGFPICSRVHFRPSPQPRMGLHVSSFYGVKKTSVLKLNGKLYKYNSLEKTFDVAAQFQQVYLQKVCKRLMDRMKNF